MMSLLVLGCVSSPAIGKEISESQIRGLDKQIDGAVKLTESTVRRRSDYQAQANKAALMQYREFWKKKNPELANLLGEWGGSWGYSFTIFPTNQPDKVCVQDVDESDSILEQGTLKNGKIFYYSPSFNTNYVLLRRGNSLVVLTDAHGKINIIPQPISIVPRKVSRFTKNQQSYESLGCITESDINKLSRLVSSSNQSILDSTLFTYLHKEKVFPQKSGISKEGQENTILLASLPNTRTWKQFVERGGDRRDIQVDYDLPNEFRNGFVYFNYAISSVYAYIFKSGLSSYPLVKEGIVDIDFELADRYVRSGQAIRFYWNRGQSGMRHLNDTEVRFSEKGVGCFKTTCLSAPFMSNTQISRILRSEK